MSKHNDSDKNKKDLAPKDLAYFVTLFKIEGHKTWRLHAASNEAGFEREVRDVMKKAVVTDTKRFKIDRITGEILPLHP